MKASLGCRRSPRTVAQAIKFITIVSQSSLLLDSTKTSNNLTRSIRRLLSPLSRVLCRLPAFPSLHLYRSQFRCGRRHALRRRRSDQYRRLNQGCVHPADGWSRRYTCSRDVDSRIYPTRWAAPCVSCERNCLSLRGICSTYGHSVARLYRGLPSCSS